MPIGLPPLGVLAGDGSVAISDNLGGPAILNLLPLALLGEGCWVTGGPRLVLGGDAKLCSPGG